MACFTVTLNDQTNETIANADAYQQEGPLMTFFSLADGRDVIDSWSRRLASFRTADVVAVRRIDETVDPATLVTNQQTTLLRSA